MNVIYGEPRAISTKDDGVSSMRATWSLSHRRCMVCWIPERESFRNRFPGALQTHELIGGAMRSHEPFNYLRICSACHARYHSGTPDSGLSLSFGNMLYCKYEHACLCVGAAFNPNWIVEDLWNWHRLGFLYRPQRRQISALCLPAMESPPEAYLEERLKWSKNYCSVLPLGLKPSHRLDPEAYQKAGILGISLLKKHACFESYSQPTLSVSGELGDLSNTRAWRSTYSLSDLRSYAQEG